MVWHCPKSENCVRQSYLSVPFCCCRREGVNRNTTIFARLYTGTNKSKLLWLHCGERIQIGLPFPVTHRTRSNINYEETISFPCKNLWRVWLTEAPIYILTLLHYLSCIRPMVDIHSLEQCFRCLHICNTHPESLYCSLLPMLSHIR